jgi:hypothetical protein
VQPCGLAVDQGEGIGDIRDRREVELAKRYQLRFG